MWSFDVFFDLRVNKQLSKQSWSWWFETLWRHCNEVTILDPCCYIFARQFLTWILPLAYSLCPSAVLMKLLEAARRLSCCGLRIYCPNIYQTALGILGHAGIYLQSIRIWRYIHIDPFVNKIFSTYAFGKPCSHYCPNSWNISSLYLIRWQYFSVIMYAMPIDPQ